MALDLGNIITTLGTEYVQARYGGSGGMPAVGVPQVMPAFMDYDVEADIPFIDITKTRKRRRRRRLLTPTDFGDLAQLKTLTGNSDAFKAAVIKAIRR